MSKKIERKTVEIDRKRIPLRKLLHGKEIREAAKALEDFRLNLNEKEILYGAKISIQWDDSSYIYAVARRLETDDEYADRLEKQRIAEELKKEREQKRKLQAEIRQRELEVRRKADAAEHIRKLAKENGLSVNDILLDQGTLL
jgi:hypothetical protein